MSAESSLLGGGEGGSLLKRKSNHDEATFDITAMIDLVFMMNIFFLVTMITAALEEINLPQAKHCLPTDPDQCVMITILEGPDGKEGLVFIGSDHSGAPLKDRAEQEQKIKAAVEEGLQAKKTTVLIKAERNVHLRDVARIGGVASSVPGIELKLAVVEQE